MSLSDKDDSDRPVPTAPAPRKDEGLMTPEELRGAISPIITDSISFVDSVLSPEREQATNYYLGKPFGNEEEGRSQIVLTELRDTVSGIAPDVLKIFFGPERTVEFLPKSAETVEEAKLQTDYIHFCFTERNAGFLESLSVLKDGLIRKIGIFKSWWDDSAETRAIVLRNVTDDELTTLGADDELKIVKVIETGVQDADDLPPAPPVDPQTGQPGAPPQPQKLHTVHLTRTTPGRLRVKALPPEEFIYNRLARDAETAILLGHRTMKTRGELLAMGVSEKDLDEYGSDATTLETNTEAVARRADNGGVQMDADTTESNEQVSYVEAYMRIDVDGDGVSELRMLRCIGNGYHVVNGDGLGEPVDDHPFSLYIPDPEPHTLHGGSIADRVMDLQMMKSSVFRAQADSLSMALFPRLAYVEGQANVTDILNTEIGAPIRMRSVGAVQPIAMPYSGEMASPMLEYLDQVVERRTGRSKGTEGLDADALQSTTAQGVDAAVSGSRAQTEMLARIFAEMTFKPLFRRLYRLVQQNQPEEYVKLRDRGVTIDPSAWEPELDVVVNVALGSTLIERKLQTIVATLAKQEQVLQTLGPSNPIVSLPMYAATLQRAVELGGFRDVESFFKSLPPDWQPPAPPPPQPSPEMAMVQIEQQKSQHAAQMKEMEFQQKEQDAQRQAAQKQAEMQQNYELEIAKMRQKTELEAATLQAQFGAQVNTAQINAEVQASLEKARIDAENQRHAASLDVELKKHQVSESLKHDRETKAMELEHQRALQVAQIAADAKTKQAAATKSRA